MKHKILVLSVFLFLFTCRTLYGSDSCAYRVSSPDGQYKVDFFQKQTKDGKRIMFYSVFYKGVPVIYPSVLDLRMDNHLSEEAMALKVDQHKDWCENLIFKEVQRDSSVYAWHPDYGEYDTISANFHSLKIDFVKQDNPIYEMAIEIRAYNTGIALRYVFPENPKGTYYNITQENTEFKLPQGTLAWVCHWAQGAYKLLPLSDWDDEAERPLTLQLPNGFYACITEARMVDYARTKFKLSPEHANTLVTSMDGAANLISPLSTPWRVIMVAPSAAALYSNHVMLLNLNEPSKIKDASWLKPGKIIRVMTQTNQDAKRYIDFCKEHHLDYILFDWKWYGPAFSFESDVTHPVKELDMPGIIRYAAERGIGVWLYVNQQGLLAQDDSLFSVYHRWGVKGVKFGFVQVGSHRWTCWLEDAIHKAAENKIMVNIHDDWRPTGEQRTYPNLMTAEGIRGNEEMPDATHNTILPFTRFMAGPADYTICYYSSRIKNTHAHQLALPLIFYSPIQTLYWYDDPNIVKNSPELKLWDDIPTVWDDTKMLMGNPGDYVVIARRKDASWYLGAITNKEARQLKVPLDFLEKGVVYQAEIYADDPSLNTQTKVSITIKKQLTCSSMLNLKLLPSGGIAVKFVKQVK